MHKFGCPPQQRHGISPQPSLALFPRSLEGLNWVVSVKIFTELDDRKGQTSTYILVCSGPVDCSPSRNAPA